MNEKISTPNPEQHASVKSSATAYKVDQLVKFTVVGDGEHAEVRIMEAIMLMPEGNWVSDPARKDRYFSTMMLSVTVHPNMPPQQIPVHYEIPAENLREALEKTPDVGNAACKKRFEEMKDAQTRQSILAGTAMGKLN